MREILQKARAERIIYGCDYCSRVNVRKETMESHEKICYYNPDRECPECDDGKGFWYEDVGIEVPVRRKCGLCERSRIARGLE